MVEGHLRSGFTLKKVKLPPSKVYHSTTIEISVKSIKDSTSTLSLVIHRVRLIKKPAKKVH
jgi:hypothetical protein